jgi:hypothetical protein
MFVNARFQCNRPAAMDQNPETQLIESSLLNEWEIKFSPFLSRNIRRRSNGWVPDRDGMTKVVLKRYVSASRHHSARRRQGREDFATLGSSRTYATCRKSLKRFPGEQGRGTVFDSPLSRDEHHGCVRRILLSRTPYPGPLSLRRPACTVYPRRKGSAMNAPAARP